MAKAYELTAARLVACLAHIRRKFIEAKKTQQLVTLADKNITAHKDIYAQIKQRTDSGLSSITDLSQVSGRLAQAQSNVIAAKNNYRDAKAVFKRLTNSEPQDLVMPVPDANMLPATLDDDLGKALSRHPIIKSAAQDINPAKSFKNSVNSNYTLS